jgi:anti-sigma factor RsiW
VAEDRFEELVGPYLLGELTVEEERKLERHLEVCSGCRRALDSAQPTHNLLRQLAANEPPAELKDQVLVRARGQILTQPWVRWGFWVTTAAALLIAAGFGVGVFRTITGDSSVTVPLTATSWLPRLEARSRQRRSGRTFRSSWKCGRYPNSRTMSITRCGTTSKMAAESAAGPSRWDQRAGRL